MNQQQTQGSGQALAPVAGELRIRRLSLEKRLDEGYDRIDAAALAGSDVVEWETFWVRLLHEYEDVCRELDIAA